MPPPAPGFTFANYSGMWYEVAKIQTFGGAIFEHNCVCTYIHPFVETMTYKVSQGCHEKTVDGPLTVVNGELVPQNHSVVDGRFDEHIAVDKVAYTIVYLDEDAAIEYDCGVFVGDIVNYCVHVMSRKPQMSQTKLDQLLAFAQQTLQLNPLGLEVKYTLQQGCPPPPQ
jgi:apolipoprotein D and lipocalin family protein